MAQLLGAPQNPHVRVEYHINLPGLISLFYISTLFRLFNAKAILLEEQ